MEEQKRLTALVIIFVVLVGVFVILAAKYSPEEEIIPPSPANGFQGPFTVAELLASPPYGDEVDVTGEATLLGEFLTKSFVITSGGASIKVWYGDMFEEDGTRWPEVSIEGFENGDKLLVTGELRQTGEEAVIWAVNIVKP